MNVFCVHRSMNGNHVGASHEEPGPDYCGCRRNFWQTKLAFKCLGSKKKLRLAYQNVPPPNVLRQSTETGREGIA